MLDNFHLYIKTYFACIFLLNICNLLKKNIYIDIIITDSIVAVSVVMNNHVIKVLQRKTNESRQQYLKLMSAGDKSV